MKTPLGRLEKVELRNYWKDEARDFTPWLAEDDNINLLGETVGMELEVQEKETRFIEYCVGNGFSEGIISPEVEREIILDYCKHTGRKTLPKRQNLYSWRRVSHHRRKLR